MIDTTTAIVHFAQKWRRWGGGDPTPTSLSNSVSPPVQYFRRLEQILVKKHFLHSLGITPTVSAQLQLICQVRLACHSTKNALAHDDTRLSTR